MLSPHHLRGVIFIFPLIVFVFGLMHLHFIELLIFLAVLSEQSGSLTDHRFAHVGEATEVLLDARRDRAGRIGTFLAAPFASLVLLLDLHAVAVDVGGSGGDGSGRRCEAAHKTRCTSVLGSVAHRQASERVIKLVVGLIVEVDALFLEIGFGKLRIKVGSGLVGFDGRLERWRDLLQSKGLPVDGLEEGVLLEFFGIAVGTKTMTRVSVQQL